MKYRVGRKQKRAILDENGIEIAMLPLGSEDEAQRLCHLLNDDQDLRKKQRQFKQIISNELDSANLDFENFAMNDEFQRGLFMGYIGAIQELQKKYNELYS